jgi:uncharacterized protein
MIIERDIPVPMDDGLVLRADLFRPYTKEPVPVLMTLGPMPKAPSIKSNTRRCGIG